jgi:hypothetical protein
LEQISAKVFDRSGDVYRGRVGFVDPEASIADRLSFARSLPPIKNRASNGDARQRIPDFSIVTLSLETSIHPAHL